MIHQGNFLDVSCIPLADKQGRKDPERKENHGKAKVTMSDKFKHLRYNHMNIYIPHLKKMKSLPGHISKTESWHQIIQQSNQRS